MCDGQNGRTSERRRYGYINAGAGIKPSPKFKVHIERMQASHRLKNRFLAKVDIIGGTSSSRTRAICYRLVAAYPETTVEALIDAISVASFKAEHNLNGKRLVVTSPAIMEYLVIDFVKKGNSLEWHELNDDDYDRIVKL